MVQPKKHQKSKPRKQQPHVKKHGKQTNITEFGSQLDTLGLKIVQVTADGNCFFRALADQLEGNEEEHRKYRLMVVKYILDHREEFEPFIEDEVPFDEYCQSMENDGTWAGHMELQAGSLVTRRNICIHRMMSPRWYIRNFDGHASHMIHLSYHNEEHYNSVRSKEDPCSGPVKPIVIKADADLSATTNKAKVAVTKSKGSSCKNIDTGSIKLVMIGSGFENADKVVQVLQQLDGDVDAAIEFLIAEQSVGDDLVENGELPHKEDSPDGDCGPPEVPRENTSEHDGPDNNDDYSTEQSDKKIPRNKVCPCGSKKKYKACCGSIKGKSSTEFVINHKVASRKGKNERKQGRKGGPVKVVPSHGSDGGDPPDMGALCI
ncbi:Ovarian tumor [Macleaya cordata]|uniref:Ovarian tumor n=1 Tax=Macleaya cordata TaxID=56857 RepID=A0A200QZG7_MACCD|nr:Ovarian tumor [Macleaya cordata]